MSTSWTGNGNERIEREKSKMRRIENTSSRKVTFSKRRRSLFKKANELGALCDAAVGIVVVSESRQLYEFSSTSSVKAILAKYSGQPKKLENHFKPATDMTKLKSGIAEDRNIMSTLRDQGQEELTLIEVARIEGKLQSELRRKLMEQITQLQAKTKSLLEENKKLKQKMRSSLLF